MARVMALIVISGLISATAYAQTTGKQAQAWFEKGVHYYEANDLDSARKWFAKAYKCYPTPELAYNVARVCERMGDAKTGVYYFKQYLKRATLNDTEKSDVKKRIAALNALYNRQRAQVKLVPPKRSTLNAEARTFFERGTEMFDKERYNAAMQAFLAAQQFADAPELYFNLALVAEKLDRPRDAIDYYREYLRARPQAADAKSIKARITELRSNR